IQRGITIDKCTRLFDDERLDNPEKASTYIYKAFSGDYEYPIRESLKENVSRVRLVNMLTFDRVDFEKNISTSVKKKVKFKDIWHTEQLVELNEITEIKKGTSITKEKAVDGSIPVVAGGKESAYFHNVSNRNGNTITISASGAHAGFVNYFEIPIFASDCNTIQSKDENTISTKLIYLFLKSIQNQIYELQRGQAQPHVYGEDLAKIKIPLPSKEIQKKIVTEIDVLEKKEEMAKSKIEDCQSKIDYIIETLKYETSKLGNVVSFKNGLNYNRQSSGDLINMIGVGDFQNNIVPNLDLIEQVQIGGKLANDYILKTNDLLVVRSNGSANLVGRFMLIDKILPNTSFSGFTIRLRPDSEVIDSKYLCYYLRSEKIREKLTKKSNGSNIKSLNQEMLSSLDVPLPPLSGQQKIVSEIEKIEAQITEWEQQLAEIPQQKEAVLKQYL
ncbi:MAG: restriction endonuclease subunit S, partial [Tannerella sp.]|nr:restriction endonuclease subunit S [Tannerella sp.]